MSVQRVQAAAIPYRRSPFGGFEVLLVSCSRGGWGLPKGGVKSKQTPAHAAASESLEEAGVLGEIEPPLGEFVYRKQGRKNRVHVLPLRVTQVLARWEEERRRTRVWVPLVEAARLVRRPEFASLLVDLRHRLLTRFDQGEQQPQARLAA